MGAYGLLRFGVVINGSDPIVTQDFIAHADDTLCR